MLFRSLGGKPDIIWASPLYTTCSIAAISTHRSVKYGHGKTQSDKKKNNILFAKSEKAHKHDEYLLDTLNLIQELKPKLYFIDTL